MIRTLALVFLSMVFIVSAVFAIAGFGVQSILYKDAYSSLLDDPAIYSRILANAPEGLLDEGSVRMISDMVLDSVLPYLRGDSQNAVFSVSPEILRSFITQRISALPPCLSQQEPIEGNKVVCRPSGVNTDALVLYQLSQINIPEVDLNSVGGGMLEKIRGAVMFFRAVVFAALVVAAAGIALILLLKRKQISSALRWAGIDLVIVGIVCLLFSVLNTIPLEKMVEAGIAGIASAILGIVVGKIVTSGIIVAAVGIVLIAASFFVGKQKKK